MSLVRRYSRYLIAIGLLFMLLAVKYLATNRMTAGDHEPETGLRLESFILHADTTVNSIPAKDIFNGSRNASVDTHFVNRAGSEAQMFPPKNHALQRMIEKKADEDMQNAIVNDSEIQHIKLLGIVFHDNKKKAYMALNSQRVIADIGDTVYGRYLLRDIAINSAELVDTKDNQQKLIFVSGK